MSVIENEKNLSHMIINYEELYLKELTYYGTSNPNQMCLLVSIGFVLSKLEKDLQEQYYNPLIIEIQKNKDIPEIFYLQKILYCSFEIIVKMVSLVIENKINYPEFELKSRYLIGMLENFVDKMIIPVSSLLYYITSTNKVFKINSPIQNLYKFININKNKFTSTEKIDLLKKFTKVINNK